MIAYLNLVKLLLMTQQVKSLIGILLFSLFISFIYKTKCEGSIDQFLIHFWKSTRIYIVH